MMKKYTAGFIGVGNMGGALLAAAAAAVGGEVLSVFDTYHPLVEKRCREYGCHDLTLEEVVSNSKYVFLGVKPNVIGGVLAEAVKYADEETLFVSMAAGVSLERLGVGRAIRIMPNTPCAVGRGMILYAVGDAVTEEEIEGFLSLMSKAGVLDRIDEKYIDAASAVSGSGPAFVYMFIDALADGGVKCGLPRDKALLYAKQTLFGASSLALESEKHPEQLKDEVCSPGGTTIEGVLALEKGAFRGSVSEAVCATYEKTKKL